MMMKYRTVRDLTAYLLLQCGDIDDDVRVKVVKRDKDGVVIKESLVQISYLDSYGNICVEFEDVIKNETPYTL